MGRNLNGWVRQPLDPRDQWMVVPSTRRLSTMVALDMPVRTNQLGLGACGPNSDAELIGFDDKAEGLPVRTISRLHHYWWTRYLMGTTGSDSGVDNRSMLKSAAAYGVVPDETLWPYTDDMKVVTTKPPANVNAVGLQNKITDYAAVIKSLGQMQGVLSGGRPWLLGCDVFPQIESDQASQTGILTDPGPNDSPIGGHDISACGYNATGQPLPGIMPGNVWPSGFFRFLNHWANPDGSLWGDGSFGYMSFAYACGPSASDFWVFNTVPGTVPTPTPQPPNPPQPKPPLPVVGVVLPPGTYIVR